MIEGKKIKSHQGPNSSYKYLKFSWADWFLLVYYHGVLNKRGPKKMAKNNNIIPGELFCTSPGGHNITP